MNTLLTGLHLYSSHGDNPIVLPIIISIPYRPAGTRPILSFGAPHFSRLCLNTDITEAAFFVFLSFIHCHHQSSLPCPFST